MATSTSSSTGRSSGHSASTSSTAPTPVSQTHPIKPPVRHSAPPAPRQVVRPVPAKKAPWRAPGNWQIPDIFKEAWRWKKLSAPLTSPKKTPPPSPPALPPKKPWIPVGKSPDVLPMPPPIVRPFHKPHAEFNAKMRKVLPRAKIMELNPRDHYVGLSKVGSGANGAVVRATKLSVNKGLVAIKRCLIEDEDAPHHSYILRELRIMGFLEHENLIQLREACLWGDYLWMAMELMACSVFGLLYNTTVGLSEEMTVRIAKECLEGLVYLHAKNYIHRDIKCENILLGRNGQVKLADFGLATPLNKINSARLGTAKWMAPEVVSEQEYKENVDVWSMAITMIEMMDRVPPLYYLESNREIYGEILYGNQPEFSFAAPSADMAKLVQWMLDSDGQQRPGAKCVLTKIKQHVADSKLACAKQPELAALVRQVFPKSN